MSSNSASIPEYLNEDLFRDALSDGFKRKDVKVESLNLKLISEGGENYSSDIYRANVQYTTDEKKIKNIVLIVKAMKANFEAECPLPTKEVDMYMEMIPKMDEILGESGVLAPKCFRATKYIYILEDLGDLGYTVQDRLKGLTEDQAHILLKKIAVFHAASMVVAEKHPDLMKKMGKSMFEDGIEVVPIAADLIYSNLEYVTQLAREWDGFEEIVIKLQTLRSTYNQKLLTALNTNQCKFKVLYHGDLWVNNMMFKQQNDTCVDVRLIDLQMCFNGSPGLDLHYFFATSVPLDIVLTKKYDLLRTYYKSLKDTLVRLNYSPVPTWDDLLSELRNTEFYLLQTALLAVPLIFLEKEVSKGKDMNSLKDPNEMRNQRIQAYKSKRTLATIRYTLDRLNDLGILD